MANSSGGGQPAEADLRSPQASFRVGTSGRTYQVIPILQQGSGRVIKLVVRSKKGSAESK